MQTIQERVRDAIVGMYRVKRMTPRENGCMEDPAPDWCWTLVDEIFKHTKNRRSDLVIRAIEWCDKGDAEARSMQLQTLMDNWLGSRELMIENFLRAAEKTGGGRQKK